jgi:thiol-disulfide isomerase/thioredoxin
MRVLVMAAVLLAACSGPSATRPSPAAPSPPTAPASPGPRPAIQGERGQIALETADGKRVLLADLGKPVTVIALWATFCHPCIEELPFVEALHQRHRAAGDDVTVLAVNIDDRSDPAMRAKIDKIERDLKLTLPRLYGGAELMNAMTPQQPDGSPRIVLPLLVVIDRTFQVHRQFGFDSGEPVARYLEDKERLIAAARRGDVPETYATCDSVR